METNPKRCDTCVWFFDHVRDPSGQLIACIRCGARVRYAISWGDERLTAESIDELARQVEAKIQQTQDQVDVAELLVHCGFAVRRGDPR